MNWCSKPPAEATSRNYELLRCPKSGKMTAWVVSQEMTGCWTHYLGKTLPCIGDLECPACSDGHMRRWYSYVAVIVPGDPRQKILELPAGAAGQVQEFVDRGTQIRGKLITISRTGGKTNGRVKVALAASEAWPENAPEPIDTRTALLHLWRVDEGRLGNQIATHADEHAAVLKGRINGSQPKR